MCFHFARNIQRLAQTIDKNIDKFVCIAALWNFGLNWVSVWVCVFFVCQLKRKKNLNGYILYAMLKALLTFR